MNDRKPSRFQFTPFFAAYAAFAGTANFALLVVILAKVYSA